MRVYSFQGLRVYRVSKGSGPGGPGHWRRCRFRGSGFRV